MYKQYYNNLKGFSQQRKILMKFSPYRSEKFRNAVHYVATSLISKNNKFLSETTNKFFTIIAIPFGIALYILILFKNNNLCT